MPLKLHCITSIVTNTMKKKLPRELNTNKIITINTEIAIKMKKQDNEKNATKKI